MSLEENKRPAEEHFPAISTCDDSMFDDFLTEDFTVHATHSKYAAVLDAGDGGRGPEAFKSCLTTLCATCADPVTTLDEIVREADRVMVLWTFSATRIGPFFGPAATHRRITFSGVNLFRIINGKLAETLDLIDRLSQWRQLGVLPPATGFLVQALRDQHSA
jgi:predicted ester cyclase